MFSSFLLYFLDSDTLLNGWTDGYILVYHLPTVPTPRACWLFE